MDTSAAVALILLVAVVLANLPFVNERLGAVGPRFAAGKPRAVRLLELLVACALTIALGMLVESRRAQVSPQGWEFFAAMAFLFLTLAFPGYVWRYLRRGGSRPAARLP